MFRAGLLTMVLTLAAGPNASLLCGPWCDQPVATTGCHHEGQATSPSVAGDDCCDNMVLAVAEPLPRDVRRDAAGPDRDGAMPAHRYQFAPSMTGGRVAGELARDWSLERRPLSAALRL